MEVSRPRPPRLPARIAKSAKKQASLHVEAGRLFLRQGLAYMAQAVAFQAFLSFVPFLLLVVSFWGHWLGGNKATMTRLQEGLEMVLPASATGISRSLSVLAANPGVYTAVSIGILLWLAGSVFRTIDYSINLAFDTHEKLNAFVAQAKGLLLVVLFGSLLGVWVVGLSTITVLAQRLPSHLQFYITIWQSFILGSLLPVVLLFVIFTTLYRLLPHRKVRWRHAARGAALVAILSHAALRLFGWMLSRSLSYTLLSGAVAALFAFLLWIYYASCIFLYGAALVATVTRRHAGTTVDQSVADPYVFQSEAS